MPAAPLDEDTQVTSGLENSPGQLLWINTQGVLEGGGELLKTGSYLNQLLTCSSHSHEHSLMHLFRQIPS